jgi:hypothetical protein
MPDAPTGLATTDGDVVLMVGTTKGAFLFRSGPDRDDWEVEGPHFPGEEVYAMALDQRAGRQALWAAPGSAFFGTTLRRSDDLGASWTGKEAHPVRFPEDSGLELKRIWQILPGRAAEPDRLFLGVEPSCVYESNDAGESWEPNRGFLEHEHRSRWTPGDGGMCLHTIIPDPENADRMLAGAERRSTASRRLTPICKMAA